MSFAEEWKDLKGRYERAVKEKKPSEKWLGQFRKSTGIESACRDLDAAMAKKDRAAADKAATALKSAGDNYCSVLDKIMDTELGPLKQMKTKNLRLGLEEMLKDAHNAAKGFEAGVFDQVLGPDIMTRVIGLQFPNDAFVKSFATNGDFKKSYTTNAVSPEVAKLQGEFQTKYQVGATALRTFLGNKGRTMPKSQILNVAKVTLEEMFTQCGRDGMLGVLRTWEHQQVKETNGQKAVMDKFLKSTSYQVLTAVGKVLNDDSVKLNAAKEKLKSLKL